MLLLRAWDENPEAWVRGGGPVQAEQGFPQLVQVVLDCTDARVLAEFYRRLLGWRYRPGDEPPVTGEPDPAGQDWLVLRDGAGNARVAFQQVAVLPEATWLEGPVPADAPGSDDPEEPLRVYADPAGHPFCIFVAT